VPPPAPDSGGQPRRLRSWHEMADDPAFILPSGRLWCPGRRDPLLTRSKKEALTFFAAGYSFGASSDARSVTIDAEKRKSVPTIESPGVAGSCSGSPPSRASPLLTCPYATRCEQAEPKKTPLKALVMRRSWVRIPSRAPGDFTFEGSSDHGFTRRAPREDGRRDSCALPVAHRTAGGAVSRSMPALVRSAGSKRRAATD